MLLVLANWLAILSILVIDPNRLSDENFSFLASGVLRPGPDLLLENWHEELLIQRFTSLDIKTAITIKKISV